MGGGIGSRPMRAGTSMKEIHWSFTGLMSEMSYIKKCSGQVIQTRSGCAWSPPDVGRQQGLSESLASWELTLLPDSSFKISRCSLKGHQLSHTLGRCVLTLLNSPKD